MNDNRKEILSGVFFIVLAIAYFCGTFAIRSYNAFGVTILSSASVPRTLAVALLFLGLIQVFNNINKEKKNMQLSKTIEMKDAEISRKGVDIAKQLADAEANEVPQNVSNRDIIYTVIYLFLYVIGLNVLGFIISTVLYIIAQTILMTQKCKRKETIKYAVLLSVIGTAAIYFLFNNLLSLMLPTGFMGF